MDQLDNLSRIIKKKEDDIVDLKTSITHIEMKNRKLNDTVNKAIHGKTQGHHEKTMEVLMRRGINSDPEKIRKQMEAGINVTSDARLQEMMKEKAISPELAMRELI